MTSINTVTAQQVTSDGTVSTTVITPDGKNFNINDGTTRGGNLFHSFKEFSIPTGGSASFNNAANIQNIISRVTGGSISTIDGLIKANGAANLFLLNPAGIIFGPNARLQIGGSFLGSTANSFVFDNGFEFSATDPQAPPLLTINVPIGLGFRDNPQNITTKSTPTQYPTLEVPEGKTITLVGGNLSLDGPDLLAPGGRVELGGLSTPGTVGLNTDGSLNFPVGVQLGDVSLTNGAIVDVSAGGGGSIAVNARNLDISGGSALYAGINQGLGSVGSQVGDITLKASGTTTVANSFVFNYVDSEAVGNSGNLTIETQKLRVSDGARIGTLIFGQGNAGNLTIKADELVEVLGTEKLNQTTTSLQANLESGGIGKGGDLTIDTKKLVVRNAQVGASTFGKGDAGNLTVLATDSVELSGEIPGNEKGFPGGLLAQVDLKGEGRGGNLTIKTGRLSVSDGSKVQVATFGQGDAGNLFIKADDVDVFETPKYNFYSTGIFAGVQIAPQTVDQPKGNAGNLTIETDRLRIRDGGIVTTFTQGEGDAGTLQIRAKESVEVFGTSLNGRLRTSTISAGATSTSTGSGGSLRIDTGKLIVRDSGTVTVSSENTKPAGQLEINARSISLDNQGSLTATSTSGNGGNIILGVQDFLLLRRNSNISTSAGLAGAGGDGGNITINSPLIVAFPGENSDITANAFNGSGGKVTINTQGLFGITPLSRQELEQRLNTTDPAQLDPRNLPTNDITAISQNNPNLSGTVNIITPDVDPTRGLFELTETVIDPAQQIAQNPCIKGFGSSFTIVGRGGIPTDPKKILSSDNVRVDLVKPVASTVSSTSATQKQPSQKPPVKEIIPARGWIYNEKGEVLLVGYDPTKTGPQRSQPAPASSCAAVR
ncbi:filamentous hemagglutinin N-terminal domain-containing protein [Brasilonema bromeliae]|uniref:two-partner secretion domain-containing protein n=1 Tax=Brasilonema bromeliae TaxID=383615 RepID=UPI001FE35C3D|nr:filamentous hemagglutinin N-terminal domain-containing protein [Brasilonema bromeliae]